MGDGIAVMTNGAQGNELALEITRSVAASYGWVAADALAAELARLSPAEVTACETGVGAGAAT